MLIPVEFYRQYRKFNFFTDIRYVTQIVTLLGILSMQFYIPNRSSESRTYHINNSAMKRCLRVPRASAQKEIVNCFVSIIQVNRNIFLNIQLKMFNYFLVPLDLFYVSTGYFRLFFRLSALLCSTKIKTTQASPESFDLVCLAGLLNKS